MQELTSIRVSPLTSFQNKFKSAIAKTNFGQVNDFIMVRVFSGPNLISSFQVADYSIDGDYVRFDLAKYLDLDSIVSGIFQIEATGYRWVHPFALEIHERTDREVRLIAPASADSNLLTNFVALQGFDQSDAYFHQFHLYDVDTFESWPIVGRFVDAITIPEFPFSVIYRTNRDLSEQTDRFQIVEQIIDPAILDLKVVPNIPEQVRELRYLRPDFYVQVGENQATDYFNWEEITQANTPDHAEIVESVLSSSVFKQNLSVNYSRFSEFVKLSSAQTRLEVFANKLADIEFYESKSFFSKDAYSTIWSSSADASASLVVATDNSYWQSKKSDVISSFDGYETFLYAESGAYSWPKITTEKPHRNASLTSSLATTWTASWFASASEYDIANSTALIKTVPPHVAENPVSTDYLRFVQMIGHYFDNIYEYIDGINRLTKRTEQYAVPPKALWDVAEGYGWQLGSGFFTKDLGEYFLGKIANEFRSGSSALSGSQMAEMGYAPSVPGETIKNEIWQRVVNSLPFLYETKGTRTAVRALTNAYGIPPSIFRINEYGTSNFEETSSLHTTDVLDSVLSSSGMTIQVYEAEENLRYQLKTIEAIYKIPSGSSNVVLLSTGPLQLYLSNSSASYATVSALPYTSTNPLHGDSVSLPIRNNTKWHVSMRHDGSTASFALININDSGDVRFFEKLELTGSLATTWTGSSGTGSTVSTATSSILTIGASTPIMEYREWTEYLSDSVLVDHARNPNSIAGNTVTSSYYALRTRFTFDSQSFASGTLSTTPSFISSSHLNTSDFGTRENRAKITSNAGAFVDWFSDQHHVTLPYGSETLDNNKIRVLREATQTASLSPEYSTQTSSNFPKGSNRLSIGFNPATHQNVHLANIAGPLDISQFVSYNDQYSGSYTELDTLRGYYLQTLEYESSLNSFLRSLKLFDTSLFEQIKKLIPVRAITDIGYTIESPFFERNRTIARERPSGSYHTIGTSISVLSTASIAFATSSNILATHSIFGDDSHDERWLGARYNWSNYVWGVTTQSSTQVKLDSQTIPSNIQASASAFVFKGVPFSISNIAATSVTLSTAISAVSESSWYLQYQGTASISGSGVIVASITGTSVNVSGTLTAIAAVEPISVQFDDYLQGNSTANVWTAVTYVSGNNGESPLLNTAGLPTSTLELYGISVSGFLEFKVSNGTINPAADWAGGIIFGVTGVSQSLTFNASPVVTKLTPPIFPIDAFPGTISINSSNYPIIERISNTELRLGTSFLLTSQSSFALNYRTNYSFVSGTVSAGSVVTQSQAIDNVYWREAIMPNVTASHAQTSRAQLKLHVSSGMEYSRSYFPAQVSPDVFSQKHNLQKYGSSVFSPLQSVPSGTSSPLVVFRDSAGVGYFYTSSAGLDPVIKIKRYPSGTILNTN